MSIPLLVDAGGIAAGTILGAIQGSNNCSNEKKDKCYVRYPIENTASCTGNDGQTCLNTPLNLPTDYDKDNPNPGIKNGGKDNQTFLYDNDNNSVWIANPNYLAQCYTARPKEPDGGCASLAHLGEDACENPQFDCKWVAAHVGADNQQQDEKCIAVAPNTMSFKTANGKIDLSFPPRYEATDLCWYADDNTAGECLYPDVSSTKKCNINNKYAPNFCYEDGDMSDDGTPSRVAVESELCTNRAVCINQSMLPDPWSETTKDKVDKTKSFYPISHCDVTKDNGGCEDGFTCRPGLVYPTDKWLADAPQPWKKYIKRPACQFVKAQPNSAGSLAKSIGASLKGLFGYKVEDPVDVVKDQIQDAKESLNRITAKSSAQSAKTLTQNLSAYRLSQQKHSEAMSAIQDSTTELLSEKIQKNTLYFNLIAIVVCVLILFELL
jgi:hypothetical protein